MILTDTLYKRVLRGFDMSLAISTLEYLQTRLNIPDSKLQTYADKSVEEMTLSEKNDFYSKLAKKWTKNDPSEFMTDKEQEKLNKTVIKK